MDSLNQSSLLRHGRDSQQAVESSRSAPFFSATLNHDHSKRPLSRGGGHRDCTLFRYFRIAFAKKLNPSRARARAALRPLPQQPKKKKFADGWSYSKTRMAKFQADGGLSTVPPLPKPPKDKDAVVPKKEDVQLIVSPSIA